MPAEVAGRWSCLLCWTSTIARSSRDVHIGRLPSALRPAPPKPARLLSARTRHLDLRTECSRRVGSNPPPNAIGLRHAVPPDREAPLRRLVCHRYAPVSAAGQRGRRGPDPHPP
jgi:hypothetical protein